MVLHQQADAFLHPIPFHLENDAFIFVALAVVNPHLAIIHKTNQKLDFQRVLACRGASFTEKKQTSGSFTFY